VPTKADFTVDYDLLIGADGARSAVRESFLATENFECQKQYISSGYKSIFLSTGNTNSGINLQPGKIHSWRMDDSTSLLLLYQPDGSMSGVIAFPYHKNQVANLTTAQEVLKCFNENFPLFGQLMSTSEAEAIATREVSRILTIRCNRFHQDDSVLLNSSSLSLPLRSLRLCGFYLTQQSLCGGLLVLCHTNFAG
jgi:kynurenine 3-monooxygenase